MELSSTFKYKHWEIKYRLLSPESSSPNSAKVVVFVHGTPWSSDVFIPIAKALLAKQQYSALLYDLPGYGQSQKLESTHQTDSEALRFAGDTSVKFQGETLAELLRHLKLDGKDGNQAPAVIAHDIAGAIALRTHLFHDCKFESLLLLDTNAVLSWGDGFYKLVRSQPDAFLQLPPHIFEAVVRAVIRSACFNPKVLDSGWEDALAKPWTALATDSGAAADEKQRSFVRQIAQANDKDVAEMLDQSLYSSIHCPVKILWGAEDGWIPREKMERLAGMLKHCLKQFVVIPEAGHLLMLDQPERVTIEVFSWLEAYR